MACLWCILPYFPRCLYSNIALEMLNHKGCVGGYVCLWSWFHKGHCNSNHVSASKGAALMWQNCSTHARTVLYSYCLFRCLWSGVVATAMEDWQDMCVFKNQAIVMLALGLHNALSHSLCFLQNRCPSDMQFKPVPLSQQSVWQQKLTSVMFITADLTRLCETELVFYLK